MTRKERVTKRRNMQEWGTARRQLSEPRGNDAVGKCCSKCLEDKTLDAFREDANEVCSREGQCKACSYY
jgi:hypothetical protein